MDWRVNLSKESVAFINSGVVSEEQIFRALSLTIKKLRGEKINIDIKKLKGMWSGYHRIRIGKLRMIIEIDFGNKIIYVDRIDFRGSVYK